MLRIPYPIPEPYLSRLIKAGEDACEHHHPRTTSDAAGPTFQTTAEYRADHLVVETVTADILLFCGVDDEDLVG